MSPLASLRGWVLGAMTLGLLLLTGCFEVEQQLSLNADGSVDHLLRIGQPLALAPSGSEERGARWVADVGSALGSVATASVETDATFTWYLIEAHLPSLAQYTDYRALVFRKAEEHNRFYGWAMPPDVERGVAMTTITLTDSGASSDGQGDFAVPATDPRYFTLVVHPASAVLDHNADRVDDGALVWERPIGAVMQNGIAAHATISTISLGMLWVGFALAAVFALGGAVLLGRWAWVTPSS